MRCDGTRELDEIIGELEELFNATDLAADIYRFIDHARQRGWLDHVGTEHAACARGCSR